MIISFDDIDRYFVTYLTVLDQEHNLLTNVCEDFSGIDRLVCSLDFRL
jgi:hypothetical protein